MSKFNANFSKENLHISKWKNDISIYGKTYYEIVRQKFNL